jgi:uncharacterized membrane protein
MEKRGKSFSFIIFLFFIPFLLWIILQFIAPLALPNNSIINLSGNVGILDNKESIEKMQFPIDFVYICGDRLCHQKVERSFFINENQMPFCSRCTAIWLGLVIGLGIMIFYKIELNNKFLILILIGIIPIAIDGVGQLLHFWESTNIIRLITGLLAGIVTGLAIGIIIEELIDLKRKKVEA